MLKSPWIRRRIGFPAEVTKLTYLTYLSYLLSILSNLSIYSILFILSKKRIYFISLVQLIWLVIVLGHIYFTYRAIVTNFGTKVLAILLSSIQLTYLTYLTYLSALTYFNYFTYKKRLKAALSTCLNQLTSPTYRLSYLCH